MIDSDFGGLEIFNNQEVCDSCFEDMEPEPDYEKENYFEKKAREYDK
jgi:hypothetical protein